MDVETLRELITAFQTLGGEAKEAFVWYLLLEYVPKFIIDLGYVIATLFLIAKAAQLIGKLTLSDTLMNSAGATPQMGGWRRDDVNKACETLRSAARQK